MEMTPIAQHVFSGDGSGIAVHDFKLAKKRRRDVGVQVDYGKP